MPRSLCVKWTPELEGFFLYTGRLGRLGKSTLYNVDKTSAGDLRGGGGEGLLRKRM